MISKEQFLKQQPVAARMLINGMKYDRLAHAYLFAGPKSAQKKEAAVLFAQSLVCPNKDENGLACQVCEDCRKIEEENSTDFLYVDKKGLNRADILDIQENFMHTSSSGNFHRVYVIDHFESAKPNAGNALLKFLEEPPEGIHAILLCQDTNQVLSTILSRCQIIKFAPVSKEDVLLNLKESMDEKTAAFFASINYTPEAAKEFTEDEEGFNALKKLTESYFPNPSSYKEIIQAQQFFNPKSAHYTKSWMGLFLDYLLYLFKNENNENLSAAAKLQIQIHIVDAIDMLKKNVDSALLMDKLYCQIRKVAKG